MIYPPDGASSTRHIRQVATLDRRGKCPTIGPYITTPFHAIYIHIHIYAMKSRTNRRQIAQTNKNVIQEYIAKYMFVLWSNYLFMVYDFVTIILGILLVQLLLILFGS